jgi:hypothetical protein
VLIEDPIAIVARRAHLLVGRGRLDLPDLHPYDGICPGRNERDRRTLDRLFAGAGIAKPNIAE